MIRQPLTSISICFVLIDLLGYQHRTTTVTVAVKLSQRSTATIMIVCALRFTRQQIGRSSWDRPF
jgi:hypothetical protein